MAYSSVSIPATCVIAPTRDLAHASGDADASRRAIAAFCAVVDARQRDWGAGGGGVQNLLFF